MKEERYKNDQKRGNEEREITRIKKRYKTKNQGVTKRVEIQKGGELTRIRDTKMGERILLEEKTARRRKKQGAKSVKIHPVPVRTRGDGPRGATGHVDPSEPNET